MNAKIKNAAAQAKAQFEAQLTDDRVARMKRGTKIAAYGAAATGVVALGIGLSALGHYGMTALGQKIWSAL